MSVFLACYELEDRTGLKSRRFDVVKQYGCYNWPAKIITPGKPFKCYLRNDHTNFRCDRHRLPDLSITSGKKSISSIFAPSLDHPLKGYGNVSGTMDALLFELSPDYKKMTIYVVMGGARNCAALFSRFINGDFQGEIAELKRDIL